MHEKHWKGSGSALGPLNNLNFSKKSLTVHDLAKASILRA